jgi:ATP phosphoribosyltransferase-like protein
MKLNNNNINTFLKNYQNLFNELFSYDVANVNVYDIVFERAENIINASSVKWNKLPKYLQLFLDNPENFEKFLDKLSKYELDSADIITYSNTDVLHLLSFATFHLCKIYYILNYQENPDFKMKIYEYYIKPFDEYLTILFEDTPYDFAYSANDGYHDSIGIFHTIQYLLLLTFSSYGLDTTYTLFYSYLDGIYQNYNPRDMIFDYMHEDIIKPLFEANFVDVYGFDLRRCFKAESTVPDFVISADYAKYYYKALLKIDNYYDKTKCLEYLKLQNIKGHHIEQYKLLLFAVIKLFNKDNYMYDLDNNGYINNGNDKWNGTLKDIWELLENTKDLRKDYNYIIDIFRDSNLLHYYWPVTSFKRYDIYENILFPILRNKHQRNDHFIVEIIQKCLKKDNGILEPSDIIRLNLHNQDIILLLLQKFFGPKITDDNTKIMIPDVDVTPMFENSTDSSISSRRSQSSVSLSRSQSAGKMKGQRRSRKFKAIKGGFIWQLRPDIASSNTSPSGPSGPSGQSVEIMKERCLLYKPVISALLKYKIKEINKEIWVHPNTIADQRPNRSINYYKTLHAYKDDLLSIGIDLNKYHMDKIIYSEPQYTPSRRSVDKSIDIDEPIPETHIFHGFLPADQKNVVQKIIKLYTRVVQSDDQSENNYDRIVKIRNYLIKKLKKEDIPYDDIDYVRQFVKKLTVRENQELEDFYNYWIKTLKKGNLNLQYIFEYQGRPGIDMKSLTRQILTQIAEQLKTHFVALEDTNRYILRPDISRDMGNFIGQIIALLPGMRSPSVVPLAEKGWFSLHSVISENDFWEIIESLRSAGAEGILVLPIEKMIL